MKGARWSAAPLDHRGARRLLEATKLSSVHTATEALAVEPNIELSDFLERAQDHSRRRPALCSVLARKVSHLHFAHTRPDAAQTREQLGIDRGPRGRYRVDPRALQGAPAE